MISWWFFGWWSRKSVRKSCQIAIIFNIIFKKYSYMKWCCFFQWPHMATFFVDFCSLSDRSAPASDSVIRKPCQIGSVVLWGHTARLGNAGDNGGGNWSHGINSKLILHESRIQHEWSKDGSNVLNTWSAMFQYLVIYDEHKGDLAQAVWLTVLPSVRVMAPAVKAKKVATKAMTKGGLLGELATATEMKINGPIRIHLPQQIF